MELAPLPERWRGRVDELPDSGERRMTRRAFLLRGLMVSGFAAIVARLWHMQVRDARKYDVQAQGNIIRFEPLRAPRGLIVDRHGTVLAQNRRSWSVALIPDRLPDDEGQRAAIRQQLIQVLGLDDVLVVRPQALPTGAEREVLGRLASALGLPPDNLVARALMPAAPALLLVRERLTPEEAVHLRALAKQLPGVHVLNRYDYLLLLHRGSAERIVLKRDVPRDLALELAANEVYLPGVQVADDALVRQYPAGPDFAHVLGYVGPISEEEFEAAGGYEPTNPYLPDDSVGRGGIEQAMEEVLRGQRGGRWIQTDARGIEVAELRDRRREPQPGYTVELTLDSGLQRAVAQALRDGIEAADRAARQEGREPVGSGVAIVLDPRNGELLALVNLPTYDNQQFAEGISQAEYDAYLNDPFTPLVNFAISGEFPPGSTIKPLLACAGLQEGVIDTETTVQCHGQIRVPTVFDEQGGNTYVCWLASGHGPVTVDDAITQSCNIFFYNVGAPGQIPEGDDEPLHYYLPGDPQPHYFAGLGIERIERYLRQEFGFGQPTGIELAGEARGVVPNPLWLFQTLREYWSVGDTINVSIGQGHLACTPIQLACALAAIANGGSYYRPRLVRSLRDASGSTVREFGPALVRQLGIEPQYLELVRRAMRRVVTDGTAKGKFIRTGDAIPIAGKTGTAEYGQAVDGRYEKKHAWFAAFAPFDTPEVLILVLIRDGGEGATFAVPVADAILAHYFGRAE
jgi:penicillin-binding protein 2